MLFNYHGIRSGNNHCLA